MTSISHALIGASIAARVANPWTVGILGIITHFVCDAIPHWDLGTNWRIRPKVVTAVLAIFETLTALFGMYLLFINTVPNQLLAIGIICSLLPDWLEVPYYLFMPKSPPIFYYIYKVQSLIHSKLDVPWGVVTQVAVVAAFLLVGFVLV